MVFTEDHAPLFTGGIADWKLAKANGSNKVIECIRWKSKIITHNKEHYVKALWGEDFRVYGPCQRFAEGDYICRSRENHDDVWVVRQEVFEKTHTIL